MPCPCESDFAFANREPLAFHLGAKAGKYWALDYCVIIIEVSQFVVWSYPPHFSFTSSPQILLLSSSLSGIFQILTIDHLPRA